jgi:hypothetical protein
MYYNYNNIILKNMKKHTNNYMHCYYGNNGDNNKYSYKYTNTNEAWLNYHFDDYYNDNKDMLEYYKMTYNDMYDLYLHTKYIEPGEYPILRSYKTEQRFLYEGLSYSYNPYIFVKKIKNTYSNILKIDISNNKKLIYVFVYNFDDYYADFIKTSDFYGYIIINIQQIKDKTRYILESKFGLVEMTNQIYDELSGIVYHLTCKRYINKIKWNGLVPKHKIKKAEHPDRIYLFTVYDTDLFKDLSDEMEYDDPVLLKIDLNKNPVGKIRLFEDQLYGPDYTDVYAVFTAENIHPQCIIDIIEISN